MKKIKHIAVFNPNFPNEGHIFKLGRDKDKYTISGSKYDKQWTKRGLKTSVSIEDVGDGIKVSYYRSSYGLISSAYFTYPEFEELGILLDYYRDHNGGNKANSRIRKKK